MLEESIAITVELRRALEAEVERSRAGREVLKRLDAEGIFAGAAARADFNAVVAALESRLAASLARAVSGAGAAEVTLARLAQLAPAEAAAFSRVLGDVRGLAATLAELDRVNLLIASRAVSCVQGYLLALRPSPTAYDRRGARSALSRSGTISSKA